MADLLEEFFLIKAELSMQGRERLETLGMDVNF